MKEILKSDKCYNCGTKTIGKYCHNCKQSSDTTRLDLRHFFYHDIIHGVFHLDKGLLFTLKEIIVRPGEVVTNFINGKRVRYYSLIYLALIILGVTFFVDSLGNSPVSLDQVDDTVVIKDFIFKNLKYLMISCIPLFTLSSWIVYRRSKLNLAEHSIIASVSLISLLLLNLLSELLELFIVGKEISAFLSIVVVLNTFRIYYQSFSGYYVQKKHFNIINAILVFVLFTCLFVFLIALIIVYVRLVGKSI